MSVLEGKILEQDITKEAIQKAVNEVKNKLQRIKDLKREETERLLIVALHTDSIWEDT